MKLIKIARQILNERIYKDLVLTMNPEQLIAKIRTNDYFFTIRCNKTDKYFIIKFLNISDKKMFEDESFINDLTELIGLVLYKYKIMYQPSIPFRIERRNFPFTYIKEIIQQLKLNKKLKIDQKSQYIEINFVEN